MDLNKIKAHVPESILVNPDVTRFLDILQEMLNVREDVLFTYMRSFYYPAVSDLRIMRRYVDEWGAEYTDSSSRLCIDCLYRNYWYIYSRKGTLEGLKRLLTCLFTVDVAPDVTIDAYRDGKPLILSDNYYKIDWLPEGQDIADELDGLNWCPTLLGDSWLEVHQYLAVTVQLNYIPSSDFLNFIRSVMIKYIPMANPNFLTIDINITV